MLFCNFYLSFTFFYTCYFLKPAPNRYVWHRLKLTHPIMQQFRIQGSHRLTTCFIIILLHASLGCSVGKVKTTHSGLQYTKLRSGKGPKAKAGQEILLFETTSYRNGTVLYSNEHTTSPVKVLIGGNQATQAVDEALRGMRAGEVKQIVAPPHLVKRTGYPPNVHPDSALVIKLILDKIL